MSRTQMVSVIIPTYKRTWEYLYRAVKSVLQQTYENVEIVVVDDSPDSFEYRNEIKEHMDELCQVDQRVRYLTNEKNIGGSLARNRGIFEAKGFYITFLDDDDEYLPEKIAHQVKFMEEQGCDLSFEDMTIYNDKNDVVDVRQYNDIRRFDNEYLLHYHLMKHMTGTPTFMFKTENLIHIGGFEDAKMGQEFYLMLKAIEAGLKIRYYPICDIKVYKHRGEAITTGKNKINGEKSLYAFKKKYFKRLRLRERLFIRFRHHAVMVVAYIRNHNYLRAIGSGLLALVVSPIDFFGQIFGFFKRVVKGRTENKPQQ